MVGVLTASACAAAVAVQTPAMARPTGRSAGSGPILTTVPARPHGSVLPGTACPVLPADDIWHADVSRLPVSTSSAAWLARMQASTRKLHPDFGPRPATGRAVRHPGHRRRRGSHAKVPVTFDYADESDRVRTRSARTPRSRAARTPAATCTRSSWTPGTCRLYETWRHPQGRAAGTAGSGATWADARRAAPGRLDVGRRRGAADPAGPAALGRGRAPATSTTRSGSPPNVTSTHVRVAGAARGRLDVERDLPADGRVVPAQGAYSTAGLDPRTVMILNAMKKHGLVLADNGSPWYFQGTRRQRAGPTS